MFEGYCPPRSEMFTSPNVRCLFCNQRLSASVSRKTWMKASWGVMVRKVCRDCPNDPGREPEEGV